ncbi:MAG: beta galactosidase jelly roll domain-containing protein [Ignavibacteriaceae bacterium]|nr:beta galactosidase jelly roll domain-containing protein [Ignavibacteriaceae bacterium]
MKIISVCLGILLLALSGCKSGNNEQEINNKSFFSEMDKMSGLNDKNYINLEGNWRFSIGDDTVWALPDFEDNNWEKIKVPAMWEDQGFHGYNGYAWYRKTFEVPKELIGYNFVLNAGFIDDVDQTFVNGKLIGMSGGFPPQYVTAYDANREYYISKEILKAGKNTIAIRVYDAQLGGGIVGGDVGLSPIQQNKGQVAYLDLDIDLRGAWKINIGDIGDWKNPGFDDKDWEEIFVPAFWETQGFKDYNGFAWYRLKFTLPEKYADQKMVLMLGMIDDIDQTFVNGTLVGSTGDWSFDIVPTNFNQNYEWVTTRGYYIPDNVLLPGKENTIAVRVYDGFMDGGIYKGPIGLVTQDKYREYWKSKRN